MVRASLRTISSIAIATIVVTFATRMFAQTVIENSAEARFQLDLHVPDAAITAMLPSGFSMNVAAQGPAKDGKDCSAKRPSTMQIWRQEQVLDILKYVTTNPPDRVKEFSFKGSGGSYAKIFDGTEKPLSWDNVVWLQRAVLNP